MIMLYPVFLAVHDQLSPADQDYIGFILYSQLYTTN